MSEPYMSDEPTDRLTHLTVEMFGCLDREENDDVRAIVFLTDADRGGIQMQGYDDAIAGMAELFVHMAAVFEANGQKLMLMNEDGMLMLGGPGDEEKDR